MARLELFVEDEVLVAWMPINNTFAWPPKYVGNATKLPAPDWDVAKHWPKGWDDPNQWRKEKYWHGLLVQLGEPRTLQHGGPEPVLDKLVFLNTSSGVSVRLRAADLAGTSTWVNIVAANGRNSRPMEPQDAGRLHDPAPNKPSLSKFFDVFGGVITLWPDRGEYTVLSRRRASGEYHNSLTFIIETQGRFDVRLYQPSANAWVEQPGSLPVGVDRIEAKALVHLQGHGDPQSPPQKP